MIARSNSQLSIVEKTAMRTNSPMRTRPITAVGLWYSDFSVPQNRFWVSISVSVEADCVLIGQSYRIRGSMYP